MLQWIIEHYGLMLSVMLGLSEALALIFPASTGFGGILAGLIKLLKSVGTKDSNAQ